MLTSHYRMPCTWSVSMMEEAHARLEYLYTTLHRINQSLAKAPSIPERGNFMAPARDVLARFFDEFHGAMCDDFNVPAALVPIGELSRAANELTKTKKKPKTDAAYTIAAVRSALVQAGAVLGILQKDPTRALNRLRNRRAQAMGIDNAAIKALIADRAQARADKNWARSDEIRDELLAQHIELMDGPDGTEWRISRVN
jgi:cysteinyl-tRNA synthetase